ncbi:DUF397 domain-containing protein [Streptomyces sp. DSM 40750]|uniref:DUF397 domain-containing protein n=1 Tax=Streptomyces sp. DSM 40750 TaxID=2801030 RepID=UPI00214BF27F|nr:DUF397 domain-containing protein [Streptomyces sp. DSM 40750]UUU23911.1 DUF397 domain-containing protein [Streptomyces sp. DSM 40750]
MDIRWCKSSFSEMGDNCLEIASCNGDVLMRESDEPDIAIATTSERFHLFLSSLKVGAFGRLP